MPAALRGTPNYLKGSCHDLEENCIISRATCELRTHKTAHFMANSGSDALPHRGCGEIGEPGADQIFNRWHRSTLSGALLDLICSVANALRAQRELPYSLSRRMVDKFTEPFTCSGHADGIPSAPRKHQYVNCSTSVAHQHLAIRSPATRLLTLVIRQMGVDTSSAARTATEK